MSHVVPVWEMPRPTTIDEAARIVLEQGAEPVGRHRAWLPGGMALDLTTRIHT